MITRPMLIVTVDWGPDQDPTEYRVMEMDIHDNGCFMLQPLLGGTIYISPSSIRKLTAKREVLPSADTQGKT